MSQLFCTTWCFNENVQVKLEIKHKMVALTEKPFKWKLKKETIPPHISPAYSIYLTHFFCTQHPPFLSFCHFNFPPSSSLLVVKWAAIVHSYTLLLRSRDKWGRSGAEAQSVCMRVWVDDSLQPQTSKRDKTPLLFSTPIDPSDRKWAIKDPMLAHFADFWPLVFYNRQ